MEFKAWHGRIAKDQAIDLSKPLPTIQEFTTINKHYTSNENILGKAFYVDTTGDWVGIDGQLPCNQIWKFKIIVKNPLILSEMTHSQCKFFENLYSEINEIIDEDEYEIFTNELKTRIIKEGYDSVIAHTTAIMKSKEYDRALMMLWDFPQTACYFPRDQVHYLEGPFNPYEQQNSLEKTDDEWKNINREIIREISNYGGLRL